MAGQTASGRDALGNLFFFVHIAFLIFIVAGWAAPSHGVLLAYLIFLPVLVLHWKLNRNACMLNNLESWLRHGRWRAPDKNPEEGAWLRTLIRNASGIVLTRARMDVIIYACLGVFWLLGFGHYHFGALF